MELGRDARVLGRYFLDASHFALEADEERIAARMETVSARNDMFPPSTLVARQGRRRRRQLKGSMKQRDTTRGCGRHQRCCELRPG